MRNHRITIEINGIKIDTLEDILPEKPGLKAIFIAKTPALKSVEAGHYFQGRQGIAFWNKLADYNILNVPNKKFEDDYLLENDYGITDIVKIPRNYGNEPSPEEYKTGTSRIVELINLHKPKVIIFIYKAVLDNVLVNAFGILEKSIYGFNDVYSKLFGSRVFVFPMPGTRCSKDKAHVFMVELKSILKNY